MGALKKPKPENQLEPDARAAIVDEFSELDGRVARFQAVSQRHQELKQVILGWYAYLDGWKSEVAKGIKYDVVVTAADNMREITIEGKQKLLKKWGVSGFLERCKLALRHLPDPSDPKNTYSVQSRNGPRHLRVMPRSEGPQAV